MPKYLEVSEIIRTFASELRNKKFNQLIIIEQIWKIK